jgi:hypothetical protein
MRINLMAENSSNSGNNSISQSPFGRLEGVLGEEGLTNIFSGIGNGEGGGSSAFGGGGGGGSNPDLAYGGNPFAGDNFWNIFAGGVNPSAGGSNQGSGSDPLTGASNDTYGISTSEIPNGLDLRVTIDKTVDSKLDEEVGSGGGVPSFGSGGGIPSFGSGGGIPSFGSGGGIPSFGSGGEIPSFGSGGGIPSFGSGGGIPSFGGQ